MSPALSLQRCGRWEAAAEVHLLGFLSLVSPLPPLLAFPHKCDIFREMEGVKAAASLRNSQTFEKVLLYGC